jgi:hypothetical protein
MLFNLKGGPELTRLVITDSAGNRVKRVKELYITGRDDNKLALELVIDGVSLDLDVEGTEAVYMERELVEGLITGKMPLDPEDAFDAKLIDLAYTMDFPVLILDLQKDNNVQTDAILAEEENDEGTTGEVDY